MIFTTRNWGIDEKKGYKNPHFEAVKHISNEIGVVIFEFELDSSKKSDCIFLVNLKLYPHNGPEIANILPIEHFLEYQGLLVRVLQGDRDLISICSTFEIRAPKDFVAFLDLYDKAARSLGRIPLFQIPEKTK